MWRRLTCCLLLLASAYAEDPSVETTTAGESPADEASPLESSGETVPVEEKVPEDVEFEKDVGVYVLNSGNFHAFLEKHPTTLVKFYSSTCPHCQKLAPAYAEAAARVSIPLAKVDVNVEEELARDQNIKEIPTLKFWKDGQGPTGYDGGREADEIVEWVSSRTDPNYKPPPEDVITLTSENFDEFIANEPLTLIEFYAPWCGHCKKLAPEYEKAAKMLKMQNSIVKLAKVDATVEKDLAQKYGVDGFPTLFVMRFGKRSEYKGPREAYGIVRYMTDLTKPPAQELANAGAIERFMEKDDVTIVGFFTDEQSPAFEAFTGAAEMLRDDFTSMGYTTDSKAFKTYDAKPNDVIIFYPTLFTSKYESKTVTFNKDGATPENIIAFIRNHCTPLVGMRTMGNVDKRYNKFPLVVVYYNADFSLQYREGSEYWRQKVLKVAYKYRKHNYRFAVADEEEFSDELNSLGLGDSGLEHNVAVFGHDGKKYVMDPKEFDGDFDENFEGFMKKLNSGVIRPYVKSAPLPRDDKGPVRTLVASNFEKAIADESKDVLIEFYAPWCGHCQKFEPKYKEMAAKLRKTQPNLMIAKFDATANDAPPEYKVEGFPTIYFAPSGKKKEPIKYEGEREAESLIKFMKSHAVKSFQKEEL